MGRRIDELWAWRFGVAAESFPRPGFEIISNSDGPFLQGYPGAWLLRHAAGWLISVPPEWRDRIQKTFDDAPERLARADLQHGSVLHELFGDRIDRTVGPAFQGWFDAALFRADCRHVCRGLGEHDQVLLETLRAACTPEEWEHSTLGEPGGRCFGAFDGAGRLMAVANHREDMDAAAVGVLAHPATRRRGFARAAVSAAVQDALHGELPVTYQTLVANQGAMRLAAQLGVQPYATHVAVRLK